MTEFKLRDVRYARLVDRYSRYIKSPVQRLKFLNSAMKADPPNSAAAKIPFLGSLAERSFLILELSKYLPPTQPAPLALRLTSILYRLRFVAYAACALILMAAVSGVGYGVWKAASYLATPTQAKDEASNSSSTPADANGKAIAAIGSEAGLSLDKVWLAEEGEGYEFYSNGARILREYETDGEQRRFYSFDLEKPFADKNSIEALTKPVGIVYHLSEGDIVPFDNRYKESLNGVSKSLVEYARERKLYNYVIDRFGRTYRIVRDDFAANHAGRSLWSDGRRFHVSLNSSFIGICLEGKSNSTSTVGPDGINEAQIYAARVLTAMLRGRYNIEDANCVTHGLVSVNLSNRLMGYHTDWVAGFPYEAVGLTDKYQVELAAVSRFGFSYDRAYLRAAGGEKWAGIEKTDEALREAARENGLTPQQRREINWRIFQQAYSMQRSLDGATSGEGEQ